MNSFTKNPNVKKRLNYVFFFFFFSWGTGGGGGGGEGGGGRAAGVSELFKRKI